MMMSTPAITVSDTIELEKCIEMDLDMLSNTGETDPMQNHVLSEDGHVKDLSVWLESFSEKMHGIQNAISSLQTLSDQQPNHQPMKLPHKPWSGEFVADVIIADSILTSEVANRAINAGYIKFPSLLRKYAQSDGDEQHITVTREGNLQVSNSGGPHIVSYEL